MLDSSTLPQEGTNLDYALAYLRQGWSVIPAEPLTKKAAVRWKEYQDRLPAEEEVKEWFTTMPEANLLLITGDISDLAVLDIDGDDGLAALKEAAVEVPATLTQKSPHGWHSLYRKDRRPIRNRVAIFGEGSHVDIRGEGGYLAVAPSKLPDAQYKWVRPIDPVPAPEWMVKPDEELRVTGLTNDDPHWVTNALVHGVKHGKRNHTAIRLAGYLYSKKLPTDFIEAQLVQYAERCEPPINADELASILDSARNFAARLRSLGIQDQVVSEPTGNGYRLSWERHGVEMTFSNFKSNKGGNAELVVKTLTPGAAPQLGPLSFGMTSISARESVVRLLKKRYPLEQQEWETLIDQACMVVNEELRHSSPMVRLGSISGHEEGDPLILGDVLLEKGPTIVLADPSQGKSWWILAAAVSLATGMDYGLGQPRRKYRVGVFDWEWAGKQWGKRLYQFLPNEAPEVDIFYVKMNTPLLESVEYMRREISDQELDFVFIDSLMFAQGQDLNDAGLATAFMNAVDSLEVGACIASHPAKGGDQNTPLGSQVYFAKARAIWKIVKSAGKGAMYLNLKQTKENDEPKPERTLCFHFDPDGVWCEPVNRAPGGSTAVPGQLRDRILQALNRGALTLDALYERLGADDERKQNQVRARLLESCERQEVFRLPDKTFALAEKFR